MKIIAPPTTSSSLTPPRRDRAQRRLALFLVPLLTLIPLPLRANTAEAPHGMVASVQPLATDAGVAALTSGGNAIDAAVATAITLGVVDGHNSGIGGGCFMLIRTADGKIVCLDGREMAPAKATRDMFLRDNHADTNLSQTGPLASGIPGSVAVYDYALAHFGKKKFADLLTPAADLAEHGFPLDRVYAKKLAGTIKDISRFDGTRAALLKADGTAYKEGETLKQPDLAQTYRALAKDGADYFYRGPFASAVGAWMARNNGLITADDFAHYEMKLRDPLLTTYRGYTIVGFPPPSSGGVHVAEILNILEHFNLQKMEQRPGPAQRIHVIAEAMKLAFADRAFFLGDPDFVHVPRGLISKEYANDLAPLISLDRTSPVTGHGNPSNANDDYFGKHTTHIAAADDQGNWVALTATVNTAFGSKVIVPGTGVILNDQMDDFSIEPGVPNHFKLVGAEANAIAPGKRPLSSMSPTIVLDATKAPVLTVGAAGGPKIITQVVLTLSNCLDLGDDLPAAMARPRFHHQWQPDELWIEKTTDPAVLEQLKAMGHTLDISIPMGATQAIASKKSGGFIGVSEPRVPGKAEGH